MRGVPTINDAMSAAGETMDALPAQAPRTTRSGSAATLPREMAARSSDIRLERMVSEHAPGVWRFLRRLGIPEADVDDALQEVILVAARRIEDIVDGSEKSFLMSTAYRIARATRRVHARRGEISDEVLELSEHDAPAPDSMLEQKRARELLDEILSAMQIDLRAVFVLYELEALTMAEIADLLELAPGTVASRLRRARADFDARVARADKRLAHLRGHT
jgi:RNA polymerase sigma-70 factor (ECF subfamily)